jgi:hypothetical protein
MADSLLENETTVRFSSSTQGGIIALQQVVGQCLIEFHGSYLSHHSRPRESHIEGSNIISQGELISEFRKTRMTNMGYAEYIKK